MSTKFYYGYVIINSPDGATIYGKTVSLIKRIVNPEGGTISEIVLQPPRNPQDKPKEINTTLTRVGSSNVFLATDDTHTFDGKITFSGDEWQWDHWSYEIKLLDGSSLKGTGLIDVDGIKTQKLFYKPDGIASVLLNEDLKSIDSAEYFRRHQEILGE